MKTITQLRKLVESAGGALEEDCSTHNLRIFQAVAPDWKLWAGSDLKCLLIQWGRGTREETIAYNDDVFKDLTERVSYGLRNMTEAERYEYATD